MKRCGWFEFPSTGERFPIRVDSDSGAFEIALGPNYDDKTFDGKDVQKLRSEAFVYLKDVTAGKWEPFVVVEHNSWGIQHDHEIHFEYRRLFRLKKADGTLVWKAWVGADAGHDGTPGGSCHGPDTDDEDKYVKCIPYSKEVWTGLLAMTEAIQTVDRKIKEMVAGHDLEARLKAISTRAQPALEFAPPKKRPQAGGVK